MASSRQPVVSPQIVEAMKRDPRVALAMQAMAGAGSGAPVVGMGDGLARVLQGAMGGLAMKGAEKKYGEQQTQYMDDVRKQIASVLGTGATPGIGGPTGLPAQSAPGLSGTGAQPPVPGGPDPKAAIAMALAGAAGGGSQAAPQAPPLPVGNAGGPPPPDPLAPLPEAPPIAPPMPKGPGGPQAMAPGPIPPPGMPPTGGPPQGMPPQAMPPGMPPTGGPPQGMPQHNQAGPAIMQPGMPNAPGIPNSPESIRKKLGMALMQGGNPYSFNQGLDDFYAGLKEDALNEADTRDKKFTQSNARYGAEMQDYFGARSDARTADYGRQRDERQFDFDEAHARTAFDRQWKLHKDVQLFQANESDKDRYWGMYKWVGEQTGNLPEVGDLEGVDNDTLFNALVLQESGGNGTAVSSQGALGSTQMLPATAHAMADKLGLPWQPALLRSNDENALEYQRTLGKAYFQEGLEKYNGDVTKALMYYHGGPDESQWKEKTRAYPGQVLSRLPAAMRASGNDGGSIPALIHAANMGGPKGTGRTLFGVSPVDHGKAVSPGYRKELETGASTLENILDLSNSFSPDMVGNYTEIGGRIKNFVGERTGLGAYEDTVAWWKQYDSMNNVVRNQLFGAALTANEQRLWDRSVITPGTNEANARRNLDTQAKLLQRVMERRSRSAAVSYNSAEVYELAGGDYMRQRIDDYKPISKRGQADNTNKPKAPETVQIGDNTFVKDAGGWRLNSAGKPKPAAPAALAKPKPAPPQFTQGLVFGKQPGQVDWSSTTAPRLLRR